MQRVAIVGFGFMGKTHYGAWKKCRGAKVVAVCDSNLAQMTSKVTGNIKGIADNSALPKTVKVWDDFSKMLEAGGFDIVDITLPTSLHPVMTIAALEAGYHVLCEKPMALDLKSCDRMLAAAAKAKREGEARTARSPLRALFPRICVFAENGAQRQVRQSCRRRFHPFHVGSEVVAQGWLVAVG